MGLFRIIVRLLSPPRLPRSRYRAAPRPAEEKLERPRWDRVPASPRSAVRAEIATPPPAPASSSTCAARRAARRSGACSTPSATTVMPIECAIEMIATAASRYDLARFGMEVMRPTPRQADLMLYFLEHGLTAAGGFSTSPAGLFPLTWDDERQQS